VNSIYLPVQLQDNFNTLLRVPGIVGQQIIDLRGGSATFKPQMIQM